MAIVVAAPENSMISLRVTFAAIFLGGAVSVGFTVASGLARVDADGFEEITFGCFFCWMTRPCSDDN